MAIKRVPPPIYVLAMGVAIYGLSWAVPVAPLAGSIARWGWPLAISGAALTLWGGATFRRARTTLNPRDPAKASRLVTHGPYRFTRNPMYLGFFLLLTGWAVALADPVGLAVPPLFVLLVTAIQIRPEERALAVLFGEDYAGYCRRVNRWFGIGGRARAEG